MNRSDLDKLVESIYSFEEHANCAGGVSSHVRFKDAEKLINHIESLDEEIEKLKSAYEHASGERDLAMQVNKSMKAENQMFREALEYYANRSNWTLRDDVADCLIDDSDYEKKHSFLTSGKRARQALSPQKKESE